MGDRYIKITNDIIGRKREPTGYIYLPGSKYREAEGCLKMRSCLQKDVINSAPMFGKYINKLELYNQFAPKVLKDTNMCEIENLLCVRTVKNVNPVLKVEREPWGASSILRKVNAGVYIFSCSVRSEEYRCKTKHAFVYASHFKPLYQ